MPSPASPVRVGLNSLRTIVSSFTEYPLYSGIVIITVCLSGLAESLGILLIIPLLNVSIIQKQENEGRLLGDSTLQTYIHDFFQAIHLEPTLPVLLALLVLLLVIKSLLMLSAQYYTGSVFAEVSTHIRLRLMKNILRSSWLFLTRKPAGLFASAIAQESHRAASIYVSAWSLVSAFIQACFFFIASAAVSIEILGGGLIAGLAVLGALHFTVIMARRAGEQETREMNALMSYLNDMIAGIKPLKAMGVEERVLPYLKEKTLGVLESRKKLSLAVTLQQNLSEPLMVVILAFGCYAAVEYMNMTLAHIAVIVIFFNRMMGRLSQMQKHYQGMSNYASAYKFVNDLSLEAESSRFSSLQGREIPSLKKGIFLKNVELSYGSHAVFKNLNLRFEANKITALTGASGVGKTSIVDLVTGLIQPQKGVILVGETPLSDIDMQLWHKQISYVPQELFLFHDTIRNNITLNDDTYSDHEVWAILKLCQAEDFVQAQSHGLDTVIGEKGSKLSGGQRQRIMIARALIRKPRLLILDEATTGLDPRTEEILLRVLRDIVKETTVIAISHQAALRAIADNVIDLEQLKNNETHH